MSWEENWMEGQRQGGQPKERDWGGLGCGMLIFLLIAIPISIILSIIWDCPGDSLLADSLWYGSKIPWLLGVVLAPSGLSIYFFERDGTQGCYMPVFATIVEIVEEEHVNTESRGTYKTYTPVYAYDLDGETIQVRGRGYSTNKDKYQTGQQVRMLVAPGEPKRYCIERESNKAYMVGKIMGGIGIVLLAISLCMWISSLFILLMTGELF